MMSGLSVSGLATGLDWGSIIDKLMAIEQRPITNLNNRKQDYQTQKDAWRDINTRLANLESKLSTLKLSSIYDSYTTTSSDDSVATATATTDATTGSYDLNISTLAKAQRIASDLQTDSTSALGLSGTIQINGQSVTIDSTYSLTDIQNAINNTTNVGVKVSIINNTLVMESSNTGVANQIQLVDDNNVLVNLGVLDSSSNIKNELQAAQDASLTINGISVTSSSNTIDSAVNGVTFNLKAAGTTTIDVSRDVDKTVNAVQAFVDQYNSVQDFISTKLSYDPDTKQAGELQGDGTLMRMQMNLRQYVTDQVNTTSNYDQLALVGISIDKDGKMSLDSTKLKDALAAAPTDVKNLFSATESDNGFDGVAVRLDNYLNMLLQTNTGVISEKLSSYDTLMKNVDDQISSLEARLTMIKDQYTQEFTAMEKAISDMQQQSNWMMSQLAVLGNTSYFG